MDYVNIPGVARRRQLVGLREEIKAGMIFGAFEKRLKLMIH